MSPGQYLMAILLLAHEPGPYSSLNGVDAAWRAIRDDMRSVWPKVDNDTAQCSAERCGWAEGGAT